MAGCFTALWYSGQSDSLLFLFSSAKSIFSHKRKVHLFVHLYRFQGSHIHEVRNQFNWTWANCTNLKHIIKAGLEDNATLDQKYLYLCSSIYWTAAMRGIISPPQLWYACHILVDSFLAKPKKRRRGANEKKGEGRGGLHTGAAASVLVLLIGVGWGGDVVNDWGSRAAEWD